MCDGRCCFPRSFGPGWDRWSGAGGGCGGLVVVCGRRCGVLGEVGVCVLIGQVALIVQGVGKSLSLVGSVSL